jgi:plastocyanin
MGLRKELASLRVATAALSGGLVATIGFAASATLIQPQYVVSQKGREFNPRQIAIRRGETVQIVNDDLDLRHHVYIESDRFRFDSGDQEPGTKSNVTIPVAGTFEALCAIHPKMRLVIEVK